MRRLKVLVSAYACEPDKGSEPGVGWNWAKQIARDHETWVVTKLNNMGSIDSELKNNPDPNLHFIYVDLPPWLRFWKRGQRGIRTYYYLWQFAAFVKVLSYKKKIRFDVSHHVTFVNDWLPSFLALLPYPFIWGPIGSNSAIPKPFLDSYKVLFVDRLRLGIQYAFRIADPFYYLTLLRASKIVLIGERISLIYPLCLIPMGKKIIQPAIGIEVNNNVQPRVKITDEITIISVGRLINIKGFPLAIRAFAANLQSGFDARLKIIGDGQERKHLEALAKLGHLSTQIEFLGNISRDNVLKQMMAADIFLFPSFEGGGMVVLEAMATGLPVVCLDFGGPGEMVTDECGIKVKPITPEQTINDLAIALMTLIKKPELRKKFGESGQKRAEEIYSWDKKGDLASELYNECRRDE